MSINYLDQSSSSSNQSLPQKRFLRLPEVLAIFGIKKTTLYAGIKAGIYPKPVNIGAGGRAVGWWCEEIDQTIQNLRFGVSL